jgi:type IV pilus assembly protein PilO
MAKGFNDLSARVQTAALIGVALVLGAAAFWYFVLPKATERGHLEEQVIRLKGENDRNEAFKREQTEYVSRIAQLKQQLETLRSIVPDEPATDAFVKTVYDTGMSTGAHIRTFVAQPEDKKELYIEMPFTLHLDGSYYDLVRFFDRMAHEQRIVTVSNLALGPASSGGMGTYQLDRGETVGANCTITTYYNRPQAAAAGKGRAAGK